MILHCFGEIDIETDQKLNRELFQKLFEQCEATGFFIEQNLNDLVFSGPFNIPDWFEEATFTLRWNDKRTQIKEGFFRYRPRPDKAFVQYFNYHFLQGEVEIEVEDLQFA